MADFNHFSILWASLLLSLQKNSEMLFLCYVCTLLSFCSHVAAMIPLIVLTSEKFMSIFRASWYRKWMICQVCTGNCPLSSACFVVILVWMHEFSLKVNVYIPVSLSSWTFLGPVLKSEVLPPIKDGKVLLCLPGSGPSQREAGKWCPFCRAFDWSHVKRGP